MAVLTRTVASCSCSHCSIIAAFSACTCAERLTGLRRMLCDRQLITRARLHLLLQCHQRWSQNLPDKTRPACANTRPQQGRVSPADRCRWETILNRDRREGPTSSSWTNFSACRRRTTAFAKFESSLACSGVRGLASCDPTHLQHKTQSSCRDERLHAFNLTAAGLTLKAWCQPGVSH